MTFWRMIFAALVASGCFAKSPTPGNYEQGSQPDAHTRPHRSPMKPIFVHQVGGDMISGGTWQETMFGLRDHSESFYFQHEGSKEGLVHANVTFFATQENVKILSLGRLDHLLHSAYCSKDRIQLNIISEGNFDEVWRNWDWVNQADENYVAFVTHSKYCDMEDRDHQPWHITAIRFDDSKNNVTLYGAPKEFREMFEDWHILASSKGLFQQSSGSKLSVEKRTPKELSINIDLPDVGYGINGGMVVDDVVVGAMPDGSITCHNCSLHGDLQFDIDIKPDLSSKTFLKGQVSLMGHQVGAHLGAKLSIYHPHTVLHQSQIDIFGQALPDLGLYIKHLVDIGPTILLDLAVSVSDTPKPISLVTGYDMLLADDSTFTVDVGGEKNFNANGWKPDFLPTMPEVSNEISFQSTIEPQLRFVLGGDIMGFGWHYGIIFGGGGMMINATSIEERHACGRIDADGGVEIKMDIVQEVGVFVTANAIAIGTGFTHTLAQKTDILFSQCYPVTEVTKVEPPSHMPTPIVEWFQRQHPDDIIDKAASAALNAPSIVIPGISTAEASVSSVFTQASATVSSEITTVVTPAVTEAASTATSAVSPVETKATSGAESVASDVDGFMEDIF